MIFHCRVHIGISVLLALICFVIPGCSPAPTHTSAVRPGSPAPGIFGDIALEAGLQFRWGHGGKTPLTILETLGHGCAFLDFDQDGLLDIFLVGTPRCALY